MFGDMFNTALHLFNQMSLDRIKCPWTVGLNRKDIDAAWNVNNLLLSDFRSGVLNSYAFHSSTFFSIALMYIVKS
jgi:hypothetical protein